MALAPTNPLSPQTNDQSRQAAADRARISALNRARRAYLRGDVRAGQALERSVKIQDEMAAMGTPVGVTRRAEDITSIAGGRLAAQDALIAEQQQNAAMARQIRDSFLRPAAPAGSPAAPTGRLAYGPGGSMKWVTDQPKTPPTDQPKTPPTAPAGSPAAPPTAPAGSPAAPPTAPSARPTPEEDTARAEFLKTGFFRGPDFSTPAPTLNPAAPAEAPAWSGATDSAPTAAPAWSGATAPGALTQGSEATPKGTTYGDLMRAGQSIYTPEAQRTIADAEAFLAKRKQQNTPRDLSNFGKMTPPDLKITPEGPPPAPTAPGINPADWQSRASQDPTLAKRSAATPAGAALAAGLEGLEAKLKPIGFRAKGGPVEAGSPYLVGEEGPELVVPKAAEGPLVPDSVARGLLGLADNGGRVYQGLMGAANMATEAEIRAATDLLARRKVAGEPAFTPIAERYKKEPWYTQVGKQVRDAFSVTPSEVAPALAEATLPAKKAVASFTGKEVDDMAQFRAKYFGPEQLGPVGQVVSKAAQLLPGQRVLSPVLDAGESRSLPAGIPAAAAALLIPGKGKLAREIYQEGLSDVLKGAASSAQPFVVGEEGPELVVPAQDGVVIPAQQTQELLKKKRREMLMPKSTAKARG